jgi:hypothetical protein
MQAAATARENGGQKEWGENEIAAAGGGDNLS